MTAADRYDPCPSCGRPKRKRNTECRTCRRRQKRRACRSLRLAEACAGPQGRASCRNPDCATTSARVYARGVCLFCYRRLSRSGDLDRIALPQWHAIDECGCGRRKRALSARCGLCARKVQAEKSSTASAAAQARGLPRNPWEHERKAEFVGARERAEADRIARLIAAVDARTQEEDVAELERSRAVERGWATR